jgi:hypothetical protein
VIIYYRTSSTTNLETGEKSVIAELKQVLRAIVLPSKIHREFVYDLTFIASNKAFTYGGHFDTTERSFIFDRKDLPDFEIKVGMYLQFSGHRYDIKQVEEFESSTAYFVIAKQAIEADSLHTIHASAFSDPEFVSEVLGPKEALAAASSVFDFESEAGGTL